ncbi:MAG: multiheme c-type cytochrome [Sulfurimonas sp.]|jgi:hypothetical protein
MIKTLLFFLFLTQALFADNECLSCHKETEKIRDASSGMMRAILELSEKAGHAGNDCIVCHGGTPNAKKKNKAHEGTVEYFKNNKGPKEFYPSPSTASVNKNTCGVCHENQVASQPNSLMMNNQEKIGEILGSFGTKNSHNIGMNKTQNPDDVHKRLGSEAYQKYMQNLETLEPHAFASEISKLPSSPTAKDVKKEPSLAALAYLNQDKSGKEMGCASCHIPHSEDGKVVHSIQSSREAKVKVDGKEYSGIPVETCAACHKSEKSIGNSYQGLIEKENSSPKKYIHMQEDVHFLKGMLCQDCHTSNDLHGDGFLNGTSATAVEIECQDCHGTTTSYPWELPLGYSDEFNTTVAKGKGRGTATTVAEYLKQGSVGEPKDGYLLSARGNPLPHAVKDGDKIIMQLANGNDIELQPLKKLKKEKKLSQKAILAMESIKTHTDTMECYTCHATWAPQHYDNYLKIDYSNKSTGNRNVIESSAFMRWEEPVLLQNSEGRVAPGIPKLQSRVMVVGEDSNVLLYNARQAHDLTTTPIQPHSVQKEARSCESCHTTPKAMGMGISGLRVNKNISEDLDENKTQTEEFKLLAPLSVSQLNKLDRSGVCLSCHLNIPKGNLAISTISHMREMAEVKIDNSTHNDVVSNAINIGAWAQFIGAIFIGLLIVLGIYIAFIKKRPINPRNEGWK